MFHSTLHTNTGAATPGISDRGLLRGGIVLALISLIGFGLLYPLAGVGLGQLLFPHQARGSLIEAGGQIRGSALVAQPFAAAGYFHPRPSAAGYDPMALAGSNLAQSNPELQRRIDSSRTALAGQEGAAPAAVPGDLLTQSGSGIDPHISPAAAALQLERVARTRGLSVEEVGTLLARHTEARQFGWLGQPRVHVLELNLALDALPPAAPEPGTTRR